MAGTVGYLESGADKTLRCSKMWRSGFSMEIRDRGHKVGVGGGLGGKQVHGPEAPEATENLQGWRCARERQSSPQRLTEQHGQSKRLVIWTFPPRYLASGKPSLPGTGEPS